MYTCTKLLSLALTLTASTLTPALDTINFPSLPSTSDHLHVYMYCFPLFLLLQIICKLHTCTASLSSFYFWSLAYIMYCFLLFLLLQIICIHALLPSLPPSSTSDHLHTCTCTAYLSSFYFWSLAYMYCFPLFLLFLNLITCIIHVLLPSLPSTSDHLHTHTCTLVVDWYISITISPLWNQLLPVSISAFYTFYFQTSSSTAHCY